MGEQSPRKAGRPPETERRARFIETILEEHAAGRSLGEVCESIQGGPTPVQFRQWTRSTPELRKRWKEAQIDHAHSLFDQLVQLTQKLANNKWDKDSNAEVTALRVAIDGLKHATARLNPAAYGEQKAGQQAIAVNIITSLPMGQGASPEAAVDTTFRVVGSVPEIEDNG